MGRIAYETKGRRQETGWQRGMFAEGPSWGRVRPSKYGSWWVCDREEFNRRLAEDEAARMRTALVKIPQELA